MLALKHRRLSALCITLVTLFSLERACAQEHHQSAFDANPERAIQLALARAYTSPVAAIDFVTYKTTQTKDQTRASTDLAGAGKNTDVTTTASTPASSPAPKPALTPAPVEQVDISSETGSVISVKLPAHIPAACVVNASQRYQVPEMALLSIMRQESGGRVGVIGKNKNGSKDYGPAQINDQAWGTYLQTNYGISLDSLLNDMCQALMVQAYILRKSWNGCLKRGVSDVWCGIANYHSATPHHQQVYVAAVWGQYQRMVRQGVF